MLKGHGSDKTALLLGSLLWALCLVIFLVSHAEGARTIGKFTYVEGKVDVLRGGALPAQPVKMGVSVFEKDIVRTKSQSKAEIAFADGNKLRLAQRSRIDISQYVSDEASSLRVIKLPRGEVRAIVSKENAQRISVSPKANRFEIHTPNAVAGARATDYFVFHRGVVSGALVREGEIYTFNPKFPTVMVIVTAGHITFIYPNQPPQASRPASDELMRIHEEGTALLEGLAGGEGLSELGLAGFVSVVTEAPETIWDLPTSVPITEALPGLLSLEDIIPPTVGLTPLVLPESGTNLSVLSVAFESGEAATYSYLLDGVPIADTSASLIIPGLTEGSHALDYTATDVEGNANSGTLSFSLKRHFLSGQVYGSGSVLTGSATGDVAAVSNESWGGWLMDAGGYYSGTPSTDWQTMAGGRSDDSEGEPSGFWFSEASGNYYGDYMLGGSSLIHLTETTLGTGSATTYGPMDPEMSTWDTLSTGTYADTPLAFGGWMAGTFLDPNLARDGSIEGTFGVTEALSSPGEAILLGVYDNPYSRSLWSSYSYGVSGSTAAGGDILGYMGGTASSEYLEGVLIGLSVDPGQIRFLRCDFTADLFSEIGMWGIEASISASSSIPTSGLFEGQVVGTGISGTMSAEAFSPYADPVGLWGAGLVGSYSNPGSPWTAQAGGTRFDGYWIGDLSGTWSYNRISGNLSATWMNGTRLGSFSGLFTGAYDGGSWKAVSLGTWVGSTLSFANEHRTDLFYFDGNDIHSEGYLQGLMGGTSSLWSATPATPAPVTPMGGYEFYLSTSRFHLWSGEVYSYNFTNDTPTTYDGGAYHGLIGGIEIAGSLEGRLLALYLDPSTNAGILKGSLAGLLYPELGMWEMEGDIYPVEMETATGISPADLWGLTPIENSYPALGQGIFQAGGAIANTSREVFLMEPPLSGPITWAIWADKSVGSYEEPVSDTWFFLTQDSGYAEMLGTVTLGNLWTGGKLSGSLLGFKGVSDTGAGEVFTGVMAAEALGTYDANNLTWQSLSLGVWLEAGRFLTMQASEPDKLTALGFPTAEVASSNLSGDLPSLPGTSVSLSGMKFYSYSAGDRVSLWATDSVSGSYSASLSGLTFTVKDPGQPTPTFYGNLYLSQAESGQWLAWLWGLGAFTDGSAYIQGGLVGAAAGRYDNETPPGTLTEGTASGIVYPTSFISHVTPDPLAQGLFDIAYLYGFSGEMLTLVGDGYFQGLLGDEGRVSMWSATSTDPAEGLMIGLYGPPAQTMDYPSHVFNAHIWPTNYPDGLSKTTTDGGSFWGYLGGIHRDIAGIPVDEIEGRITTIYIDPSQNAGFLLGSFSGSFDVDNVQWWTDDLSVYPVQMATGIGIAPADLYSNISQMPYYMDESPEFTFEVPPDSYAMGYAVERPFDSTGEFSSIAADWGIWSTMIGGSYYGITPSNDWNWSFVYVEGGEGGDHYIFGTETFGSLWLDGKLTGSTFGYQADLDSASTSIVVGETLGTFDPTAETFQAVQGGVYLETNRFLSMTQDAGGRATLQRLNIPCVEVGRATLTGSWSSGSDSMSVNMSDVIFFAPSSGARPRIWATNAVSGSYGGDPSSASVSLAGNGLSADFDVRGWDTTNSKWLARISNGQGSITGGGSNVQNLKFHGAAAGTINQGSGTFSGTGAGVAK